MFSADGLTYNYSAADLGLSNLDRYPGFDCVDRMEATMQPGDILYNPSWMWQCVQNEAPTIGVRCGFVYPPGMLRESMTLTFIRAFAGNPSMLKTAWYSFIKTDLPDRRGLAGDAEGFHQVEAGNGAGAGLAGCRGSRMIRRRSSASMR
jgi:hypothetical protein